MKPWEELRYVIQHYLLGKYDTDTFSDVYYDIYVHKMYGYKLKNIDKDVLDKLLNVSSRYSPYREDRKTGIYFSEQEVKKQAAIVYQSLWQSEY